MRRPSRFGSIPDLNPELLRLLDEMDRKIKNSKFDATTVPGVTEDDAHGYEVGSRWIDVTGDDEYVCVDATTGAASWLKTTP